MDFKLTEEQTMLQSTARKFTEERIISNWEYFRENEFRREIHEEMADLGFSGINIPEEYDGAGMDEIAVGVMTEEISRGDIGVSLSIGVSLALDADPIKHYGTQEQKKRWLPFIAQGGIAAFAQTESDAGSDITGIKTRGVIQGDDIVISGTKQFITNGRIAKLILVIVRTNPHDRYGGLTAVLVDADEAKKAGTLYAEKDLRKLGLHSSVTSTLVFNDCRVPYSNILGEEGYGFIIANSTLIGSRPMVAEQGVGLSRAVLDETIKYATERDQFGRKIAEFQGIYLEIAEMATKIEAARSLANLAAWTLSNVPAPDPLTLALGRKNIAGLMSKAKLFAASVATDLALKGVILCGGMGYMREKRFHAFYEDAPILHIYEGTDIVHKYIIAREIFEKHGINLKLYK